MDKCLSIITNFGCHFTCPYCVVKNNHIDVPPTTIESLELLKEAIAKEGATRISVSGGGDPLHEYHKHVEYYDRLFQICDELNIPIDMHTSYIDSDFPFHKCRKVVYHCRTIRDLMDIARHGDERTRVVYVVTRFCNPRRIELIEDYVRILPDIDELSFRQMIDSNYQTTNYWQDFLREGHGKRWWYIEQDDYNSYFVNGVVYHKFSDIGKEEV